jgi:hypothetical protein
MISVEKPGSPSEILEHVGVKGMKWGVRKATSTSSGGGRAKRVGQAVKRHAGERAFALKSQSARTHDKIIDNANERFMRDLPRIKARHGEYSKLSNRVKKPFSKEAKAYRADVKNTYLRHLEKSANEITNESGTLEYTLSEGGKPNTSAYFWQVRTRRRAQHADTGSFKVRPIFDSEGWIVNLEIIKDEIAQTMLMGAAFLIHIGIDV